ncbi:hypothetical protein T484DRAFT_2757399 [Baffinella frigidus]|nr:hypothetical protein T484DRAFT_2757399 [Cryptophyta sp. CCMP2293]
MMLLRALVLAATLAVAALASGQAHGDNHHISHDSGGRGRRHGHVQAGLARRAGGKLGGTAQWSNCTGPWPPAFRDLHIPPLCAEVDLIGTANECSPNLRLGVKFEGDASLLFEQDISLRGFDVACASLENLTASSNIVGVCGQEVHLCLDFLRQGQNTLEIGADFVAGCPSILVTNCKLGDVVIPQVKIALGCFTVGSGCHAHTTCTECLASNCGWCAPTPKWLKPHPRFDPLQRACTDPTSSVFLRDSREAQGNTRPGG